MTEDDGDMAWRTAVPMVQPLEDGQVMYVTTPQQLVSLQQQMPYDRSRVVAQQAMLQQQMPMQQQLAQQAMREQALMQQQMYGYHQYGGIQHGSNWPAAQAVCGGALGTTNPTHTGWPYGYAFHAGGAAIYQSCCAPAPVEDAGIRAGEIEGFRAWLIGGRSRTTLNSIVALHEWPSDGIMRGMPGDHDGMGVHAFKTESEAQQQYSAMDKPMAFGRVAMWGEIVEHEDGYRAEFAKITAIDSVQGVWLSWTLRRLRRHYGLTGHD